MLKQIIQDIISACDDGLIAYEDDSDLLFGDLKSQYARNVVIDIMEEDRFVALPTGFYVRYFEEDCADDDPPVWILVAKPDNRGIRWVGSALHYVDDYSKDDIDDAIHQAIVFYKPHAFVWD